MKLPELEKPENYGGLYVFDFGNEQTAVGYTAEEIAVLLESEQYKDGKAYRIHRALPDGTLELQGVARERFQAEEGMFFYRSDLRAARADLDALDALVENTPPPCRVKGHLARVEGRGGDLADKAPISSETYITAVIYPAEYSPDVAKWLNDGDYRGGDHVEGGIDGVTHYYALKAAVLDQRQWWPTREKSRSAQEVLASTHLAIQRRMVG